MTEQCLNIREIRPRPAHPGGERVAKFVRIEPGDVCLVAREDPRLVERLCGKLSSRADTQEEQERRLASSVPVAGSKRWRFNIARVSVCQSFIFRSAVRVGKVVSRCCPPRFQSPTATRARNPPDSSS
jgi:hypothetical protein